jgi:hypothetical protein
MGLACMGDMRDAYILVGSLNGTDHLEDLGVDIGCKGVSWIHLTQDSV